MAAHLLRAYKSKLLIDKIRPARTRTLFEGLSVGFLFNAILPLRLGELVRAYYVGDALSISKTAVFMSIIIERIVDGLILGVCFISAGILLKSVSLINYEHLLRFGLGIVLVSSLLSLLIYYVRSEKKFILNAAGTFSSIFNTQIANRVRHIAWSAIYGTKLMLSDQTALLRYLFLSVAMWLLYFASTALVAVAYFGSIGDKKIWLVTQATYAGVSAPAGPGYVGTFHIIVSRLLNNVGLKEAGGFALLMWLVLIIPISIIGLCVLIKRRFNEKSPASKEDMLINKLYRDRNISDELAHFLEAYFKGERINQVLTEAELNNKFKLIKLFRGGSNAHTMLVWQNGAKRVKKIALPQYADKLVDQAKWLNDRASLKHIPNVMHEEKSEHYYYFDIEYYEKFNPFFDYIHSHTTKESSQVIEKILTFMDKSIYKNETSKNNRQSLDVYIKEKIIQKAADTASLHNGINELMSYKKLKVNGVKYDNLGIVIDRINRNKKALSDLATYSESPIHGDLSIDNLIVSNEGKFLVLDPNNENQVSTKAVDMGKLYQSLHSGYEFLIQIDSCEVKNESINFKDSKSHKYAELYKLLDEKLKDDLSPTEYRSILFHEGVHYCRLLTYRVNIDSETAPVFYATAVKLFNEFLDQYEQKS